MHDRPPLTVVMLHALGASGREFHRVEERLRGVVPTMALDLPGFGDEPEAPGFTVDAMAVDVARRVRDRGIGRLVLVGHSMGGKVATVLASRSGAETPLPRVEGVVLLAASPPSPEPMSDERRAAMLSWAADGPLDEAAAREFVDANVGAPLDPSDDALMLADLRRASPAAWRAWLEDGSREDWAPAVGEIDLPAVILSGGADGDLGPSAQRRLNGPVYPGAEFVTLAGAGHLLPLERPAEVAREIARLCDAIV